ncbi:MAG: hypothetical protein EZS28_013721 [Streblomastix strix]|uniref:Uncharacterized protein n=1 Tax=Streblomastix strix TaxID=222440 RepID=A0A5J4W736_9EUKA|nr:MAG: hypothetical protein EZS28_013721 [Streblomastix strix]
MFNSAQQEYANQQQFSSNLPKSQIQKEDNPVIQSQFLLKENNDSYVKNGSDTKNTKEKEKEKEDMKRRYEEMLIQNEKDMRMDWGSMRDQLADDDDDDDGKREELMIRKLRENKNDFVEKSITLSEPMYKVDLSNAKVRRPSKQEHMKANSKPSTSQLVDQHEEKM